MFTDFAEFRSSLVWEVNANFGAWTHAVLLLFLFKWFGSSLVWEGKANLGAQTASCVRISL